MNRAEIDESEHVAAQSSDLRSTNPWLASYGRDPARGSRMRESRRATRSSGAALKLRLWTGAAAAVLLMLGISSTEDVEAEGARASPGHPATVAQIVGHADDRGDATANRRVEILVQKSPTESLP